MRTSHNQPYVSIVLATFNRAYCISASIDSILGQDYKNFELIIYIDGSTDNTTEVIKKYDDERIVLIENKHNRGLSAAKNSALKQTKGEIIFITDDDVIAYRDWLTKGLAYFEDAHVIGIEGKIVYVHEGYQPQYSDRIVENRAGNLYMNANAAYRRQALFAVGLFKDMFRYEDRDLAFRLAKYGKIVFASDAVIVHQKETYSIKAFMREASRVNLWLNFYIKHNDRTRLKGVIYQPKNLLAIFFPPLVLLRLFQIRLISKRDWLLFLLMYPRLIWERLCLWRAAIKKKVFII